jgi:hypothetical protein
MHDSKPDRKLLTLLLSMLVIALGGVSSAAEEAFDSDADKPPEITAKGLKGGCFYVRDVNNWEAVNRSQIIVYAPSRKKAYLLSIAPPTINARSSSTLGFRGRDRICGRAGDRVLFGSGMDRGHSIMDVRRLDEATLAAYEASIKKADEPEVVPAKESPGAEVETDIQPDDEGSDDK